MADFILAHKKVNKSEGGYSNNPNDRGNYVDGNLVGTNYGISAPVLKEHLGRTPTKDDMINLSPKVVLLIYKKNYWNKIQGDNIDNQSVAYLIYDSAVNQGLSYTKSAIKEALFEQGEEYEGINANQINKLNQKDFFLSIFRNRLDRYSMGAKEFKKGWINRLNEIKFIGKNDKSKYYLIASLLFLSTISILILIKITK
jgi:lysozyme family protein|tara:strand:- start:1331 stop:1927 length:597 start_codon:yes stop_codon:yes gene_type:complete